MLSPPLSAGHENRTPRPHPSEPPTPALIFLLDIPTLLP